MALLMGKDWRIFRRTRMVPPSGRLLDRARRTASGRWSLRILWGLIFVAVFADFLANDKPLVATYQDRTYFPVAQEYAVDLGLSQWPPEVINRNWAELDLDWAVWPLVPYAWNSDLANTFRSPFDEQRVRSWRWRHWLGTDRLGHDITAGLIAGTRVALLVGLVAMAIALIIGIVLGGLAGFFGDDGLYLSRGRLLGGLLGMPVGIFYGFVARGHALRTGSVGLQLLLSLVIVAVCTVGIALLLDWLLRRSWWRHRVAFPADLLVMRLIELINSIPALLLLIAVLALLRQPTIFSVMTIIGLLVWTDIARFVRSEMLRIRRLDYISAARVMGLSQWRILLRHALPNALTPVLISLSFGIAGAILLEAFLSFLGIGLPPDVVTWGSMLQDARANFSAWWLAVFPGAAIFVTVTVFNLLGEALTEEV